MSSYILPIEEPEATYSIEIERFDPDRDDAPHWERYEIPWVPTMTVMEALEWLQDEGHYVAFRANCREFTCGSCAMSINGKPGLACDTLLTDGTRLAPMNRYRVKRDLVVDTDPVRAKWRELELWPHEEPSGPIRRVPKAALESWHRTYARCIECYACLDACPASGTDTDAFSGPMWMLQIARSKTHPLDGFDRLQQAVDEGAGRCVSCYECADVCPVGLSPVAEVQGLRRDALWERVRRLFGASR